MMTMVVAASAVTTCSTTVHAQDGSRSHRWQPLDSAEYVPFTFADCGRQITISVGDVFAVEYREFTKPDGATVYQERGPFTGDLTDATTGELLIDELDLSGKYREKSRDGTIKVTLSAPTIVIASPEEYAQFDELGLPHTSYVTQGKVVMLVDDETGAATPLQQPRRVTDICRTIAEGR